MRCDSLLAIGEVAGAVHLQQKDLFCHCFGLVEIPNCRNVWGGQASSCSDKHLTKMRLVVKYCTYLRPEVDANVKT